MILKPILIKNIFSNSKTLTLQEILNLWSIEDNAVIGLDLQMSFVFEITLPDLLLKEEQEHLDFFSQIKNIIHSVPDNISIQFLNRIENGDAEKIKEYQKITKPEGEVEKLIVKSKIEHLNNIFIQNKKYYLYFTTKEDEEIKQSLFKIVNKDFKKITAEIHKKRIAKLKELSSTFVSGLSNLGIKIKQLETEDIVKFLYEYLNPSRKDFMECKRFNPSKTLRTQINLNACENEFDYIYMDGFYYRTINLYFRPESINFFMLWQTLYSLIPDCDISFSMETSNQEKFEKSLQLEGSIARNISMMSTFKKNYSAETLQQSVSDFIEETKATYQKFFYYSLCIIIRERNLEELTRKTNMALQNMRSLGDCEGIIDDMNHLFLYLSALPGHGHLNFRKHIFHTDAITQMLPLFAEWKGCREPRILFQTEEDQILPINLFDETLSAKHGLVLGQTGSGKSFTTNFLLTNFFIESELNHIVIIDVGGSYRKLCSTFNGQYLEVDLSEKFAFNPFPSKDTAIIHNNLTEIEIDSDVVSNITTLIQKMLKIPELSGREQKLIENAINNTYKNTKNEIPLLEDLHLELLNYLGDDEDKKTAKEFAKNIEIWTTGRYGKLLNRHSTLNTDNRLVVFDLQNLNEQPELQSIIFFLISTTLEKKLKNKLLKKIIVIDEGWKFFNDEVGSLLIQNLYRTARKFNAGILSISQSPTDFLSTKASNAIISNSYIKYILRLKTGYEILKEFGLNFQEIEKVKMLRSEKGKFSEVFLKFSENSRVIKIQPSPIDYWICTTDPEDTKTEDDIRKKHPEYTAVQILEQLVAIRKKVVG